MTGTIKVSTSKLRSTATSFSNTANQIKTLTSNMTSTVEGLSGAVWSGDAANAYKRKFKQLDDDIAKLVKMINEHATDLNEMARSYSSVEAENVSAAGALSDDVVK